MTEAELAYAAGIIDGEGCITGTFNFDGFKRRPYLALVVAMKDTVVPQSLAETFQTRKLYLNHGSGKVTRWQVNGKKMIPVLTTVLPFLRLKRRQAELALAFLTLLPGRGPGGTGLGGRQLTDETEQRLLKLFEELRVENRRWKS